MIDCGKWDQITQQLYCVYLKIVDLLNDEDIKFLLLLKKAKVGF